MAGICHIFWSLRMKMSRNLQSSAVSTSDPFRICCIRVFDLAVADILKV